MQEERRKKAALWREQQMRQKLIGKQQGTTLAPSVTANNPAPKPAFPLPQSTGKGASTATGFSSSSTLSMQATSVGTITHTSTAASLKPPPAPAPARVLPSVFGDSDDDAGGLGRSSRALMKLPPLNEPETKPAVAARASSRGDLASNSKGKAATRHGHERDRAKLKPMLPGVRQKPGEKPLLSPKIRRTSSSEAEDGEDPLEAYMKSLQTTSSTTPASKSAPPNPKPGGSDGDQSQATSTSTPASEAVPSSGSLKEEPMDTDSGVKQDGAATASASTKKQVVIMTGVAKKKPEKPASTGRADPDVSANLP